MTDLERVKNPFKRWWRWQTTRCSSCNGLRWFNMRHGEDCWWWAT